MNISQTIQDSASTTQPEKGQDSHSSVSHQVSRKPSSESAQQELWEAIKSIIALQNQIPPLKPLACHTNHPLSFTQERLWLLDKANPGTTAYNLPFAFQLRGNLNISALDQSVREILQRHTALRTTIAVVDGKAVQRVASLAASTLVVVDLQEVPETERFTQAKQQAQAEAQRSFDLATGPLMRTTLLKLGETEHLLVLTIHHIVFDGWSEGIVWRELSTLYRAFSEGQPSPLAELPIQYGDYAHWQRQWMQGELQERLLRYWQGQLKGSVGELPLPADHPRPVGQQRPGKQQRFSMSPELTARLKGLSRQEGTPLFALLLAAFKVLLHHYSGQEEILVCTPIANRNRKELQQVVGYFVNLLALQTDVSGNPSFRALVGRVRQGVTGAYAHQDLPVQQVVSQLGGVPIPLSQVMFVLQNMPHHELQLVGIEARRWELESGTADFDLAVSLVEEDGCLTGTCSYNEELFEAETIGELLQDFEDVLTLSVAAPERPISQLLPWSEAKQRELAEKRLKSQAPQHQTQREYVAARNELECQLVTMWQRVLGVPQVGVRDNFFELGGYSLLAAQLLNEIEKTFSKNLTLTDVFQSPTIEQLANILTQENWSPSLSALVPIQPQGPNPPLFAIHYLGTNMRWYRPLSKYLGLDQPIYGLIDKVAIQNVLNTKQASPALQVEELAAYYIKEMRTFQPEGPYFMSGISFGGTIAFEMARQLHQQGQEVGLLALLDTLGPDDSPKHTTPHKGVANHLGHLTQRSPKGKLNYLVKQIKGKSKWVRNRIMKAIERQSKNITEQVQALICKAYVSMGRPLPQDLLDARIKTANDRARKAYIPKPYPGRVTLFRAVDSYLAPGNPDMGWSNLAGGGLDLHYVPGGHSSMYDEPHAAVLAEKLKACLTQEKKPKG